MTYVTNFPVKFGWNDSNQTLPKGIPHVLTSLLYGFDPVNSSMTDMYPLVRDDLTGK